MRNRKEMIAFGSLAAAVLSCVLAALVVPEVRVKLGLPVEEMYRSGQSALAPPEAPGRDAAKKRPAPRPRAVPRIIHQQMDSARVLFRNDGFSPTDEPVYGTLASDASDEFELDLQSGVEYFIDGVCDNDCSDLDLVLSDADGQEVDSDRESDDVPLLLLKVERTGSYVLSVRMVSCSSRECHYGMQVFQKHQ